MSLSAVAKEIVIQVNAGLCFASSILFIPLTLAVLIKYRLKIERAGLIMLTCLLIVFLA